MSLTNTNTNSNNNNTKPKLAKVLFRSARRQDFKTMKFLLHNLNNVPLTNVEKSKIMYETVLQGKGGMTKYLKNKKFKVIWKGGEILKALKNHDIELAKRLNTEGASFGNFGEELTYVIDNLYTFDVKTIKWVLKYTYNIHPTVYYIDKFLRFFLNTIGNYNNDTIKKYIEILRLLTEKASSRVPDKYRIRWSPDREEFQLLLHILSTYEGRNMNMKEWIDLFIKNGAKFSKDGGEIIEMLRDRVDGNLIIYAIEKGAQFDKMGYEISQAIEEGYTLEMIRHLRNSGARWHGTEIEMACEHQQPGQLNIIKYLVTKKAPWNGDELRIVIEKRLLDILKFFLKHNVPKDQKALLYSVKTLNYDAMKILLESGGFRWSHDGKEVLLLCRHLRKLNNPNNVVNIIDNINNVVNNNNVETSKQIVKKMLRLCVIYKASVSFNGTCPEYRDMLNAMKKSVKTIEQRQFQRTYNPYTSSPSLKRKAAKRSFNNI